MPQEGGLRCHRKEDEADEGSSPAPVLGHIRSWTQYSAFAFSWSLLPQSRCPERHLRPEQNSLLTKQRPSPRPAVHKACLFGSIWGWVGTGRTAGSGGRREASLRRPAVPEGVWTKFRKGRGEGHLAVTAGTSAKERSVARCPGPRPLARGGASPRFARVTARGRLDGRSTSGLHALRWGGGDPKPRSVTCL